MEPKMRWQSRRKGERHVLRQGKRTLVTIERRPEGWVWFNAWNPPCKPTDKLALAKSNALAHTRYVFAAVDRAIERSKSFVGSDA